MNKKSRNCGIKKYGICRPIFHSELYHKYTKESIQTGIAFLAKYASMREMGYLRNDKIYSGNTRLKKVPESGAKTTPTRILWVFIYSWRMGRDSNPRWSCPHNGFQDRRIRPLCHPSKTFLQTCALLYTMLFLFARLLFVFL